VHARTFTQVSRACQLLRARRASHLTVRAGGTRR
jgi:hypothetical protein